MQPITIEPLSYIAFVIIIITLIYSFLSYRKKEEKEMPPQKTVIIKEAKESVEYERPALAAAIAMMMEGKPYRVKSIVLTGKQEKISSWRHFGRQEIMRRRMNMQN
jgi:hypothetical protein